MLIKRLIGIGTIMVLLGASSVAFAQDGGMTPDAVTDGGADAETDATPPDAGGPPPVPGEGYQDCTDDMDCEDLGANPDVVIRCVEYPTAEDPDTTFRFCRVDVEDSSDDVPDSSPIDGIEDEVGSPCEDDTDCDDGTDGYPIGTFSQCDPSFLRCRPIDQGAIGCMSNEDCPRNESCNNDDLCDNRATDRDSNQVPCGRDDNCGRERGEGCSVSPTGSPLASTGLGLLVMAGLLLMARRTRRS